MNLAALIAFGVPALLIVILTRGRLGYQPDQEQPETNSSRSATDSLRRHQMIREILR